jgi:hypothetical protein
MIQRLAVETITTPHGLMPIASRVREAMVRGPVSWSSTMPAA